MNDERSIKALIDHNKLGIHKSLKRGPLGQPMMSRSPPAASEVVSVITPYSLGIHKTMFCALRCDLIAVFHFVLLLFLASDTGCKTLTYLLTYLLLRRCADAAVTHSLGCNAIKQC